MAPIPASKPSPISATTPTATTTAPPNTPGATAAPETSATATADTDTTMTSPTSSNPNPKKRKRNDAQKEEQSHILFQTTFRKTAWCYLHLMLITPSALTPSTTKTSTPTPDLSLLLISHLLTRALTAYLGTTGAAIPVDILHTWGRNVWVRVPRGDARGVRAAVSGWVGNVEGAEVFGGSGGEGGSVHVAWRVVGCGGALGLVGVEGEGDGEGREMFG